MLSINLEQANPTVSRRWLSRSGLVFGGTGLISIFTLIDYVRRTFPEAILNQLPNYDQFIYMAVGVAFITALPLVVFRRVISISLAQFGISTSFLYLIYAVFGVFLPDYRIIWMILLALAAAIFALVLSTGIAYAWKERSWSDFVKDIVILLCFILIWLYPLWTTGEMNERPI